MNPKRVLAIAGQELRQVYGQRTLALLVGVLSLLLAVSLIHCRDSQRTSEKLADDLQQLVNRQWEEQPDRHPHRVAHYGNFAIRPPTLLSLFDSGVDSFAGKAIFLEAHQQNSANFAEAREANGALRFGQLTPAFILQTLLPLLLIFCGCSTITREREQQTLPLLLIQGVNPVELLVGKLSGLALAFLSIIVPLLSLSVLVVASQARLEVDVELAARLALLLLGYALYLGTVLSICVLVSNRSRTTSQALLRLLTLWLVGVVFLPKMLPSLGEYFHPSPSRPQFELALHEAVVRGGHGHNPEDTHFDQLKQELLGFYQVDRVENLPVNFRGVAMKAGEQHSAAVYQEHFARLKRIYESQNRFSEVAALVDPYLAIRAFSQAVTGTDYRHVLEFESQAEAYRYDFIQQLNDLHIHEVGYQNDKEQRLDRSHWKEFPSFQYRRPSIERVLADSGPAMAGLLFWFLLVTLMLARERVEAP